MKRLVPPVLFLICLILMALLRWLWPLWTLFPAPHNLLGTILVVAGLAFGLLGVRQFRAAGTNIRPFKEADKLVTGGPYRYSRNPMYLGLAVVLVGAWVLMGALSPLLGPVLFVAVANSWYISFEERMLRAKFGAEFDAYRGRTRRWL